MLYEVITGNDRGTIRPQQGLERWCSRLVAEGSVLPPRDLERLHAELARRGAARLLGVITSYSIHYTKLYEIEPRLTRAVATSTTGSDASSLAGAASSGGGGSQAAAASAQAAASRRSRA